MPGEKGFLWYDDESSGASEESDPDELERIEELRRMRGQLESRRAQAQLLKYEAEVELSRANGRSFALNRILTLTMRITLTLNPYFETETKATLTMMLGMIQTRPRICNAETRNSGSYVGLQP